MLNRDHDFPHLKLLDNQVEMKGGQKKKMHWENFLF